MVVDKGLVCLGEEVGCSTLEVDGGMGLIIGYGSRTDAG